MRFHPPFQAFLKLFSRKIAIPLGFVVVFYVGVDLAFGRPLPKASEFVWFGLLIASLTMTFSLVFYLLFRYLACSVDANGITGTNFWGRRATVRWSELNGALPWSISEIPYVVATTASAKKVYVCVWEIDRSELLKNLNRWVEPEHPISELIEKFSAPRRSRRVA